MEKERLPAFRSDRDIKVTPNQGNGVQILFVLRIRILLVGVFYLRGGGAPRHIAAAALGTDGSL